MPSSVQAIAKMNPFRPNSPVNPGMFIGRIDELRRIERALTQTVLGEPAHFMVTGERGIGKTSLLLYLDAVASGKINKPDGSSLRFLVLHLDIDESTTQSGLLARIESHLDTALGDSEPARKFLKDTWSLMQRIRINDSGLESGEREDRNEVLMDQFATSIAKVANRICSDEPETIFSARYQGILILIDEADNSSLELKLGSFLKLLLERLQKNGCNHVLVGLAGLTELRTRLHRAHPSSLRIFEELPLGRLSDDEIATVIDICIKKANEKNPDAKITITSAAKALLCKLSEGYPHFIQQFGSSAFEKDSDNVIDEDDVRSGALSERGALELIGDRYYRDDFYNRIQQDSYRQVLRIMADDLDGWVTRAKIRLAFKGSDAGLNNALKSLRDRHISLPKEGHRGIYRLQHKGFALWIKLYTSPGSAPQASNKGGSDTLLGDEYTGLLTPSPSPGNEDLEDESSNADAGEKK